jgi:hypothetical protein
VVWEDGGSEAPLPDLPFDYRNTEVLRMEIRLRPVLFILLLAVAVIAAAAIGPARLRGGAPASGTPAVPTIAAAMTQTLASLLITFADESATWDWQVSCEDPGRRGFNTLPTARSG